MGSVPPPPPPRRKPLSSEEHAELTELRVILKNVLGKVPHTLVPWHKLGQPLEDDPSEYRDLIARYRTLNFRDFKKV